MFWLYKAFECFRTVACFWKWSARRKCHGSIHCCQYVDWPNDNR